MSLHVRKDKNGKPMRTSDGTILWYFRDYYTDMTGKRKQYSSQRIRKAY